MSWRRAVRGGRASRWRPLGWMLLYVVAAAGLALSWNTVTLHAVGVKALQGVELTFADMRILPGDPVQPLAAIVEARSSTGLPYTIGTIRAVLRRGEQIVGTRTPRAVEVHVSAAGTTLLELPLDPGSAFRASGSLQALLGSSDPWALTGELTILVPQKRSAVRMEFELDLDPTKEQGH